MSEQKWKLVPVELLKDLFAGYCGPNAIGNPEDLPDANPQPPALGGEPKVLGYMWKTWQNDAPMVGAALMLNGSKPSFVIELVDRAHVAWLQAEVERLKDERGAAIGEYNRATNRCAKSEARTAELEELLEEYQWQYQEYDHHYHKESGYRCPSCGEYREVGHRKDCDIGAALAEGAKS